MLVAFGTLYCFSISSKIAVLLSRCSWVCFLMVSTTLCLYSTLSPSNFSSSAFSSTKPGQLGFVGRQLKCVSNSLRNSLQVNCRFLASINLVFFRYVFYQCLKASDIWRLNLKPGLHTVVVGVESISPSRFTPVTPMVASGVTPIITPSANVSGHF